MGAAIDCQILVVDDSDEVAEAVVLLLEQHGYQVSSASNAAEALELLRKQRPQLVLVDLVMPVVSGLELIDTMKQDEELASIPVVVITGSGLKPHGVSTLRKPFALNGLLGAAKFYCHDHK
jgi:CheY-like chemotaxis protein